MQHTIDTICRRILIATSAPGCLCADCELVADKINAEINEYIMEIIRIGHEDEHVSLCSSLRCRRMPLTETNQLSQ